MPFLFQTESLHHLFRAAASTEQRIESTVHLAASFALIPLHDRSVK